MRVLWVTNDLPPRAGGIERFVGELVARVDPAEAAVIGPAYREAASWDDAQVADVHRWRGMVHPTPALRREIVERARSHRAEVILFGAAWPLGLLAPRLRGEAGIPVVGLTHGLEAGLVTCGMGALVRRAIAGLDLATTISDFTESHVRRASAATPLSRVAPGVDVERFQPDPTARAAIRARLGIASDDLVVGNISRLVSRKGQDRLLDAWPRIRARHPRAHLVLVGEGPLERRLRRHPAARDRSQGVIFAGRVAGDELPKWYAALDVFALPCRTRWSGLDVEGLGIVTLEAQAVGVPVIVGASGGAAEAVGSPTTGTVIDGGDPTAIVAAIDDWLGAPERRRLAAPAARRWVVDHWSWPVIAERFRTVLTEVIARSRRV
ncbi:MAG: glycosyltransferase family 4 protein [Nitriliruptoraceae bacterium]